MFALTLVNTSSARAGRATAVPRTSPTALEERRSRRVLWLVAALIIMSLLDLAMTAAFMSGPGMYESNPLVAWLVRRTNSIVALVVYKLVCMSLTSVIFLALRRRRSAE